MSPSNLFFPFSTLHTEQPTITSKGIALHVEVESLSACCPDCSRASSRIHSRYTRTVKDLPVSGLQVHLSLHVRRFFCDNPTCSRKTFTESPSELAVPYARKTVRLTETLCHLGFALGGEQGARIASILNMSSSPDTFLRLIRKTTLDDHPTPTHLGVDDWAFRRNVSYGTILVDLQDHHVVDLLPDRQASTVEAWLLAHPGVQLISRDRAGEYAMGARKGAPEAVQVADRFHVHKNLAEAVERIFHRHQKALQQIVVSFSSSSSAPLSAPIPRPERQKSQERTRTKRVQLYEAVRALYLQGVTLSEIARRFHMGRMTVQKFAYADAYPETAVFRARVRMLHPYEAYLQERWQQGCRNASQLHRELIERGYEGKRKQVARFVAYLRQQLKEGNALAKARPQGLTPRQAVSLLMCRRENLTEEQRRALGEVRHLNSEIERVMEVVDSFVSMLRTLQGQHLEEWMEKASQSGIGEIRNFVEKLRKDQAAVQAGLTLQWNNGVVEGHVDRLKCIKRMMYGRAKFDLLRQRVLYRSPSSQELATPHPFHAKCG